MYMYLQNIHISYLAGVNYIPNKIRTTILFQNLFGSFQKLVTLKKHENNCFEF